jgi:hypothetical protein
VFGLFSRSDIQDSHPQRTKFQRMVGPYVKNILKFFFFETTVPFDSKHGWKFQEHMYLCVDRKFKMAAVAGHRFRHGTI